jgi:hypothetical protein
MSLVIITESEKRNLTSSNVNYKTIDKINEVWDSYSITERIFVVEFLSVIYPEKVKILSESRWYNTVADIIGIFDPTGVVDIMNGISYWRQGDKLFAILSWIGAVPGLGDLIAKPVIGVLKIGSTSTKAFKAAVETGNVAKIAETAQKAGSKTTAMVRGVANWGDNLVSVLRKTIGRLPIGLPFLAGGASLSGKGFVKTVEGWVDIFKQASTQMKSADEVYKGILQAKKPLTALEKETLLKQLEKQKVTAFRGYKPSKDLTFSEKYIAGGLGKIWGNRATRSLMTRTKSYLGFLDYLGIGDFDVDPEDLKTKVPDVEQKLQEYAKTEQGKKYFKEDFGDSAGTPPPGLTDSEWAKVSSEMGSRSGKPTFDIAGAFANNSNPILSLFGAVLK